MANCYARLHGEHAKWATTTEATKATTTIAATTTTLIKQLKTYLNTYFHVTAQIMRWNVDVASALRKSRRQVGNACLEWVSYSPLPLPLLLSAISAAFNIYF